MKRTDGPGIEEYVRRISPHLGFYYRASHVMTGNREDAELVLANALSRFYSSGDIFSARVSMRSGILREIRATSEEARRKKRQENEMDWHGINPEKASAGPIVEYLATMSVTVQRYFVMRYGCGLPLQQISRLTETSADAIKKAIARTIRNLTKELEKKETAGVREQQIAYGIRQHMHRENDEPIDIGHILHTLEEDLASARQRNHAACKVFKAVFTVLFTLLMVALLWLLAVLIEI